MQGTLIVAPDQVDQVRLQFLLQFTQTPTSPQFCILLMHRLKVKVGTIRQRRRSHRRYNPRHFFGVLVDGVVVVVYHFQLLYFSGRPSRHDSGLWFTFFW